MHCMKQTVAISGGWGLALSKSCISHFFIQPVFGDSLLSKAYWQSAIHWKNSGKSISACKADASLNKSLTISSRGSPLRVRPEWSPLDNNKCFAKRHVNTPQSVSFFCLGHWGVDSSQLFSWKRVLSSPESHWSSFPMNPSLMVSKIVRYVAIVHLAES